MISKINNMICLCSQDACRKSAKTNFTVKDGRKQGEHRKSWQSGVGWKRTCGMIEMDGDLVSEKEKRVLWTGIKSFMNLKITILSDTLIYFFYQIKATVRVWTQIIVYISDTMLNEVKMFLNEIIPYRKRVMRVLAPWITHSTEQTFVTLIVLCFHTSGTSWIRLNLRQLNAVKRKLKAVMLTTLSYLCTVWLK